MVTTRSMSTSNPTSKSTVKPPKVVERNSTRRKSGTVKPPKVVERNSTRRKSGTAKTVKRPPKCIERNLTRMDALSLFMIREYLPQYFEANPPCPTGPNPSEVIRFHDQVIRSGHEKWFYMSESEKAPWIELVKEMLAKGINLLLYPARDWSQLLQASN